MHKQSSVEIHWYLLKLSSRNKNKALSWGDNCQKLMKFAHFISIPNQISENLLKFIQVIVQKQKYGRTDGRIQADEQVDGQIDGLMDTNIKQ